MVVENYLPKFLTIHLRPMRLYLFLILNLPTNSGHQILSQTHDNIPIICRRLGCACITQNLLSRSHSELMKTTSKLIDSPGLSRRYLTTYRPLDFVKPMLCLGSISLIIFPLYHVSFLPPATLANNLAGILHFVTRRAIFSSKRTLRKFYQNHRRRMVRYHFWELFRQAI